MAHDMVLDDVRFYRFTFYVDLNLNGAYYRTYFTIVIKTTVHTQVICKRNNIILKMTATVQVFSLIVTGS